MRKHLLKEAIPQTKIKDFKFNFIRDLSAIKLVSESKEELGPN